ncbi:MAG: HAD family hydrolase [Clostridia bacterium]|nr:HAD family hydrolase [Clostridia bacterium]
MENEFENETIVAICYDFDKTLSPRDMQEFAFIPRLGYTADEFWARTNRYHCERAMDKILAALFSMFTESKDKGFPITAQNLKEAGEKVKLFNGLDTWFDNINIYAASIGIKVEHYIISAGIKEMIEGTSIAKNFKYIYASSFLYDENGEAVWPKQVVNDIMKTQILYRINKGCLAENDERVNDFLPRDERRVRFENLIFIGDSETDIPCMSVTQEKGGFAIGVYNPEDVLRGKVVPLLKDKRIGFFAPADYSKGKELYNIVKKCLARVHAEADLERITKSLKS